MAYPTLRQDSTIDGFLNDTVQVPNPWHWLETVDSPDTVSFIAEQNKLFQDFVSQSSIDAPTLTSVLTDYHTFDLIGYPTNIGEGVNNWYYWYVVPFKGKFRQLYRSRTSDQTRGELFLDFASLKVEKMMSNHAVDEYIDAAHGGSHLSIYYQVAGRPGYTVRVKSTVEGSPTDLLPDVVEEVSEDDTVWLPDGSGFYYKRHVDDTLVLAFHKLGTAQSDDQICYVTPPGAKLEISFDIGDGGKFGVLGVPHESGPGWIWSTVDLTATTPDTAKAAVDARRAMFTTADDKFFAYSAALGDKVFFISDTGKGSDGHTDYSIQVSDRSAGANATVSALSTEQLPGDTLQLNSCTAIPSGLLIAAYVGYWDRSRVLLRVFDGATGKVLRQKFTYEFAPGESFVNINNYQQFGKQEVFMTFDSYLSPRRIYRWDPSTDHVELSFQTAIAGFNPGEFESTREYLTLPDGKTAPIEVTGKKTLKGKISPLIHYDFLQTNEATSSYYRPLFAYALQHLDMRISLVRESQPSNISYITSYSLAAQYVVDSKYTRPELLVGFGEADSGYTLTISANKNPERFGAVIVASAQSDLLRYDRFTVGIDWFFFSNPTDPDGFASLRRDSPLDNVRVQDKGVKYPAYLLWHGDHDDLIWPSHSYKLAAELQRQALVKRARNDGDPEGGPFFLSVGKNAGFAEPGPTSEKIARAVDFVRFITNTLKLDNHA